MNAFWNVATRQAENLWRWGARLLAVSAILVLGSCGDIGLPSGISGFEKPDAKKLGDTVTVALLLPKSDAETGAIAQSIEQAARLAGQDARDVSLNIVTYDTAANPEQAAQQAKIAVTDGADIIVGPLFAETSNAAALAVANSGVNVLSFSNNTTIAGNNLFLLGGTFSDRAIRLMRHAKEQGYRRSLLVYPTTLEGEFARTAVQNAALFLNAPLSATVPFEFTQQGILDAIPIIKSEMANTNADSIVLTARTSGALPILTQLLYDSGVKPDQIKLLGLARWDVPAQGLTAPGIQGGWFVLPDQTRASGFSQRFQAAYGTPPHPLAGLGYDGIAAIAALVNRPSTKALDKVTLTQPAGYVGVEGIFRLMSNGLNQRGYSIGQVDNGTVSIVSPAPRQF